MIKIMDPKARKGLITLFLLVLLISLEANAQNEVAIGSTTTKSNAILWLNGNGSQGLILPVVTNKSAVSGPDKGMIVYDNADNKVWYRSDNAWVEVGGGGATTANLSLALSGNQLQLKDGTTVQSTVNIAGGTSVNGAFMAWNGSSWVYANLSGDVNGVNGSLSVDKIKGNSLPALPTTAVTQALVWDGTAWKFQPLTGSAIPTLKSGEILIGNGTVNSAATLSGDATLSAGALTIANNAITTTKINANAVDATKLADGSVTSIKIQDATITGADIAATTITADKLSQSAATSGQVLKWNGTNWVPQNDDAGATTILNNGQILTGNGTTNSATTLSGDATLSGGALTIGNNAITTAKINANAVDATKLADGSVTNLKVASDAITSPKILDATITGADIAATTITGNNIAAATIPTNKIAQSGANSNDILKWDGTNWVPAALTAGGTVTQINTANGLTGGPITNSGTIGIASGGVGATELADNAVVSNKIADNAVLTSKISNNAVDNTKLADNAVTSVKIADATIAGSDIAATTITGGNIAATTITADKLAQSTAAPGQVLKWNGTNWVPQNDNAGTGTVSSVGAGTGLTGGPITTSGTLSLANTAVTPSTYGTTTTIPQITIDQQGRITAANNQTIPTANTTTTGLINSTDWNTFNSKGNGTVTNVAAGTGLTGGPITTTGSLSLANTAVTPSTYGTTTTIPQITIDQQGRITAANNQTIPTANTTTSGLLTSADWNTFSNKISTLTSGTGISIAGTTITNTGDTDATNDITNTTTAGGDLSGTFPNPTLNTTATTGGNIITAVNNASTSINGARVDPTFGVQPISTSGTLSAGATTVTGLTIGTSVWPASANGVLTNTGGTLSWGTPLTNPMTASGDIIYGGASGVATRLAGATGFLKSNGTIPSWSAVNLAGADVTGILPVANGGTGKTTWAGLLFGSGSTLADISTGTDGQVLKALAGTPTWQNLAVTSADITDLTITDIDVSAAAAIAGTKINPDFGSQNVTTTGTMFASGGVSGLAFGGTDGVAIRGTAQNNSTSSTGLFGVINTAGNTSPVNIGVRGYVDQTSVTSTNYGVMGTAINSGVINYGIYAVAANATTNWAGYFLGNTAITGGLAVGPTPNFGTSGQVLTSSGPGATPTWAAVSSFSTLNTIPKGDGTSLVASSIFDNGNVGIGSITPSEKLDVTGNVKFSGALMPNNSAGTAGQVLTSGGAGAAPTWASAGSATGWTITGNAGTTTANYIGTNSNVPLNFKVNSTSSGMIDSDATAGATENTFFGFSSGATTTGTKNTAMGFYALRANVAGADNTAIGDGALANNNALSGNTAIGRSALSALTRSGNNTAYGTYNTAVGYQALVGTIATTDPTSQAYFNTALGYNAGSTNTTGVQNTFIGAATGPATNNLVFATAIGAGTVVSASNTMVFGETNTRQWGFGVQPAGAAIRVGNATNNGNGATLTLLGVWTSVSDSTKKYHVKSIGYGLKEIMRLKPVNFQWKGTSQQDFGFLAQEVKSVLPEIVYGEEGQMTMSYSHITAVLTKAMQEQQQEIEALKAKLKEKDDQVNSLEGSVSSMKDELDNIKRVLGIPATVKASSKK